MEEMNEPKSRSYRPNSFESIVANVKRRKTVEDSSKHITSLVEGGASQAEDQQKRSESNLLVERGELIEVRLKKRLEWYLGRIRKLLGDEQFDEWKRAFDESNRIAELKVRRLQEFESGDCYYV